MLKFRKIFIKIGEFWTTIANNQPHFENKITNMRKRLTKYRSGLRLSGSVRGVRSVPQSSTVELWQPTTKQLLAQHSHGARALHTCLELLEKVFPGSPKTGAHYVVLFISVHSSFGRAPRVAVRPSLCSGPALPPSARHLVVSFCTRATTGEN